MSLNFLASLVFLPNPDENSVSFYVIKNTKSNIYVFVENKDKFFSLDNILRTLHLAWSAKAIAEDEKYNLQLVKITVHDFSSFENDKECYLLDFLLSDSNGGFDDEI